MDYAPVLEEINAVLRPQAGRQGRVASYIPALARIRADQFGIALRTRSGVEAAAGDCDTLFSIQSVSKVFSLTLACKALATACGSAWAVSHRATRSIRWCNSKANRASRATRSSMPAPS